MPRAGDAVSLACVWPLGLGCVPVEFPLPVPHSPLSFQLPDPFRLPGPVSCPFRHRSVPHLTRSRSDAGTVAETAHALPSGASFPVLSVLATWSVCISLNSCQTPSVCPALLQDSHLCLKQGSGVQLSHGLWVSACPLVTATTHPAPSALGDRLTHGLVLGRQRDQLGHVGSSALPLVRQDPCRWLQRPRAEQEFVGPGRLLGDSPRASLSPASWSPVPALGRLLPSPAGAHVRRRGPTLPGLVSNVLYRVLETGRSHGHRC